MTDAQVQAMVEAATLEAYNIWKSEHPFLASAMDGIAVRNRVADTIRNSPEFAQVMEAAAQAGSDAEPLRQLLALAEKYLPLVLAL